MGFVPEINYLVSCILYLVQKVIFSKCNGPSCNLVTKNETVRIKKLKRANKE